MPLPDGPRMQTISPSWSSSVTSSTTRTPETSYETRSRDETTSRLVSETGGRCGVVATGRCLEFGTGELGVGFRLEVVVADMRMDRRQEDAVRRRGLRRLGGMDRSCGWVRSCRTLGKEATNASMVGVRLRCGCGWIGLLVVLNQRRGRDNRGLGLIASAAVGHPDQGVDSQDLTHESGLPER